MAAGIFAFSGAFGAKDDEVRILPMPDLQKIKVINNAEEGDTVDITVTTTDDKAKENKEDVKNVKKDNRGKEAKIKGMLKAVRLMVKAKNKAEDSGEVEIKFTGVDRQAIQQAVDKLRDRLRDKFKNVSINTKVDGDTLVITINKKGEEDKAMPKEMKK